MKIADKLANTALSDQEALRTPNNRIDPVMMAIVRYTVSSLFKKILNAGRCPDVGWYQHGEGSQLPVLAVSTRIPQP